MDVLNSYAGTPEHLQDGIVAIGNFDGVHRGHQVLLQTARERAQQRGSKSGAMIFEPHPREFFQPDEPHFRLTPLPQKLAVFENLGMDFACVLRFDKTLSELTAETFCSDVLKNGLRVHEVVIGYDFFFGKGRDGSPDKLKTFGLQMGFKTTVVEPVADNGEAYSSTSIRLKLAQGDVKGAAHSLGRWWQVQGDVIGGAHRGTGLGFPTANIPLPKGTAIAHGIYAVRVGLNETGSGQQTLLNGAAYLGTRPTFDDGKPVLEVFLFDFDGDLYGRTLTVTFIDYIRPDRKFDDADALIRQMKADCDQARAILAEAPETPR